MSLMRAITCVLHYKVSTWLQKASNWHLCRAEAIHADIRLRRMCNHSPRGSGFEAGRVLLASIVGLAVCFAWIWFAARAGR